MDPLDRVFEFSCTSVSPDAFPNMAMPPDIYNGCAPLANPPIEDFDSNHCFRYRFLLVSHRPICVASAALPCVQCVLARSALLVRVLSSSLLLA